MVENYGVFMDKYKPVFETRVHIHFPIKSPTGENLMQCFSCYIDTTGSHSHTQSGTHHPRSSVVISMTKSTCDLLYPTQSDCTQTTGRDVVCQEMHLTSPAMFDTATNTPRPSKIRHVGTEEK